MSKSKSTRNFACVYKETWIFFGNSNTRVIKWHSRLSKISTISTRFVHIMLNSWNSIFYNFDLVLKSALKTVSLKTLRLTLQTKQYPFNRTDRASFSSNFRDHSNVLSTCHYSISRSKYHTILFNVYKYDFIRLSFTIFTNCRHLFVGLSIDLNVMQIWLTQVVCLCINYSQPY